MKNRNSEKASSEGIQRLSWPLAYIGLGFKPNYDVIYWSLVQFAILPVGGTGVVSDDEGNLGGSDLEAGDLVDVEVAVAALGNVLLLPDHSDQLGLVDLNCLREKFSN